jgi:excinuclease UvrABC nuclease subunit
VPFENHGSRAFTASSIDQNAPSASGVYGLSNAKHWIYVGETGDIHAELRRHLQNRQGEIGKLSPAGFTFELSAASERVVRRGKLIQELKPAIDSNAA